MRRRGIAVMSSAAIVGLTAFGGEPGGAADDEDGAMAEEQFETYLATHTMLVPLDVTCAPLAGATASGPMICYALVGDRQTVAAIAELDSSASYRFISINKIEVVGAAPGAEATVADAAVLELIGTATSPDSRLPTMILQANPQIASVDHVGYFEPTGTLEISVTTTAPNDDVRSAIAFVVTAVASALWAENQPLRDSAATIQPRLEVTVDGTLYSSAFGMMTRIADRTMPYAEWLALTGVGGFTSTDRLEHRSEEKRWPAAKA